MSCGKSCFNTLACFWPPQISPAFRAVEIPFMKLNVQATLLPFERSHLTSASSWWSLRELVTDVVVACQAIKVTITSARVHVNHVREALRVASLAAGYYSS